MTSFPHEAAQAEGDPGLAVADRHGRVAECRQEVLGDVVGERVGLLRHPEQPVESSVADSADVVASPVLEAAFLVSVADSAPAMATTTVPAWAVATEHKPIRA